MRIASLDIGTNTLLMTIAESHSDGSFTVLHDAHTIVRLGENLAATGLIGDAAIDRACACLAEYNRICRDLQVDLCVGVATSAVRTAVNGKAALDVLRKQVQGTIHCISGMEEAELTFRGTVPNEAPYVVLDIGGGSTEIVYGVNAMPSFRESFELGAVVVHERFLAQQPVSSTALVNATTAMSTCIHPSAVPTDSSWIGVAGTPTTLALIIQEVPYTNVDAAHDFRLSYSHVCEVTELLLSATRSELFDITGIHPKRADILPAGAWILREIMRMNNVSQITVSTRGLRYGVLQQAYMAASRREV